MLPIIIMVISPHSPSDLRSKWDSLLERYVCGSLSEHNFLFQKYLADCVKQQAYHTMSCLISSRLYIYVCNIPKHLLGPALKGMKAYGCLSRTLSGRKLSGLNSSGLG
jgi:hypothetical protein